MNCGKSIAVRHKIYALGGVAGKNYLLRGLCADKITHSIPCTFIYLGSRHAKVINPSQRVGVVLFVKLTFSVKNTLGTLSCGSVVNIYGGILHKQRKIRLVILHCYHFLFLIGICYSKGVLYLFRKFLIARQTDTAAGFLLQSAADKGA